MKASRNHVAPSPSYRPAPGSENRWPTAFRPSTWRCLAARGCVSHSHGGLAGTAGEQGFAGPGAKAGAAFQIRPGQGRGRFVCKLKLERLASTGKHRTKWTICLASRANGIQPPSARAAGPHAVLQIHGECTGHGHGTATVTRWSPPEAEAWSPVAAEGLFMPESTARPSATASITSAETWWRRKSLSPIMIYCFLTGLPAAARAGQLSAGAR